MHALALLASLAAPAPAAGRALPETILEVWWFGFRGPTIGALMNQFPQFNLLSVVPYQSTTGDANYRIVQSIQSEDSFRADIAAWRKSGRAAVLMIGSSNGEGGEGNGTFLTPANAREALASFSRDVDAYGFDGIEWDLEDDARWNPETLAAVNAQLRAKYGPSFVIGMAPRPFELRHGQRKRAMAQAGGYDYFAVQYYFPAQVLNRVLPRDVTDFVQNGVVPADKFVLALGPTLDNGKNADARESATLFAALKSRYPTIRGAALWESTAAASTDFATIMAPVVGPSATGAARGN